MSGISCVARASQAAFQHSSFPCYQRGFPFPVLPPCLRPCGFAVPQVGFCTRRFTPTTLCCLVRVRCTDRSFKLGLLSELAWYIGFLVDHVALSLGCSARTLRFFPHVYDALLVPHCLPSHCPIDIRFMLLRSILILMVTRNLHIPAYAFLFRWACFPCHESCCQDGSSSTSTPCFLTVPLGHEVLPVSRRCLSVSAP